MRSFLTFLSLFTLMFFLAPILCLGANGNTPSDFAVPNSVSLPQTVTADGKSVSVADLLVGKLALWDLRGYQEEALKAAAVVATSQLIELYQAQNSCDGWEYKTAQEVKSAWGDYWFSQYWPAMQEAVVAVWGQKLSTETAAVPQVFALSWGVTEQGIECPYDFTSNEFETVHTVSIEEFLAVFPEAKNKLTVKKAQSNRVETVTSGNTVLTGKETAAQFALPSPCFSISVEETRVVFTCKGKGDGVGMSLYGANEMAKRGTGYKEILALFYPDGTLT